MWDSDPVLEAVLLVGGQGTRLRPLTVTTPKPMLPVAGVPCTEHQIARAREAGVTRVILGTSYKPEVFAEYFGDGSRFGVELVYATEDVPLGTGGAIRHVAPYLISRPDDPVLIFNGDLLTGHDIAGQVKRWRDDSADVSLYLTRVDDPRAYGLVPTDADGRVLQFLEKPSTPEECVTDQINAGCYVFRRSLIDTIPVGRPVSVERETFPELLSSGALVTGFVDDGYWLDLGTPLAFVAGVEGPRHRPGAEPRAARAHGRVPRAARAPRWSPTRSCAAARSSAPARRSARARSSTARRCSTAR